MSLIASRLREVLSYDESTGEFRWKVRRGQRGAPGALAGYTSAEGYVVIRIDGRDYRAHRLAWLYQVGEWPENEVDHINGVRRDNAWKNLRDVSREVNSRNQRAPHANSTTGYAGVTKRAGGRFYAHITVGGRKRHLGSFERADDASHAYQDAKRILHSNAFTRGT